MGETKNEPRKANGRSFEAHIVEPRSSTNLNRANLRTTRANENATPMHNPRTTRAYSVSFPVCIARSQLSNISTSGHTKHVTRIAMAIIRHVRERIGMKYTVQTRELDPKIARGETKRLSSITGCSFNAFSSAGAIRKTGPFQNAGVGPSFQCLVGA
jgi:hypothetical protein